MNEVTVVERLELEVGSVPHATRNRAGSVGEFHLQVELAVAIGPQLLPRREKHLVDRPLRRQFRNPFPPR
jgi:hypothetical protein